MSSSQKTNDGTTTLAQKIINQYIDWRTDRKTLQDKWEKSRENFLGINLDTWKKKEGKTDEAWRSDTHINMTRQKVSTAVAMVLVNMMQGGKINFDLLPSAWDKLTFQYLPQEIQEMTKMAIRNMKRQIEQQLTETNADRSFMRNVLSCALYGETVSKRVVGEVSRSGWRPKEIPGITNLTSIPMDQIPYEPYTEDKKTLFWEYRPIWNIFRDLEEDDPRKSHGWIDRDLKEPHWLAGKKGQKFWIDSEIDKVLKEAQSTGQTNTNSIQEEDINSLPPHLRNIQHRKKTIRILEYWGRMPTSDVKAFEEWIKALKKDPEAPAPSHTSMDNEDEAMGKYEEVFAVVAGTRIVAFAKTKTEDRPFERAVWDDQLEETSGSGVADNMKATQLTLNGAIRAFEDNKKLSGNVITALKRRLIDKMDKTLGPGSVVEISEDCDDVRQAIQPIVIPDVGATLLDLISLMEKYADDDSMIPKIQQGISSQGKETAFEVNQRLEASGNYIAGVIRNIDEHLVEPNITAYYNRNMKDPDVKMGKGSYTVKALGYSSFQNRFVLVTKLQQFLNLLLANEQIAIKYDLDKLIARMGASLDVDTTEFEKSPEQLQAEQQFQQQLAMEQAQLAKAEAEANVTKTMAEAQAKQAETVIKQEQLKNDRAKIVLEMEKVKQGSQPAPATGAQGG